MPLYQSRDPYSALAEGLGQGLAIGGNILQIKADRARQKFDQEWRQFQSHVEIAGNKNLPKEMRLSAINSMIDFKNKLNPTQTQGEHLTDLPSYSDEMFKKIKFVKDDKDKDIPEKLRIINMLAAEYADTVPHVTELIKPDIKDLERQERLGRLGTPTGRRAELAIGLRDAGDKFAVERFKDTGDYPKEDIGPPTIKTYFNKTTGDTLNVNEEDPAAVAKARSTGYVPYVAVLHGESNKQFAPQVESTYVPVGRDQYQFMSVDRVRGTTKPILRDGRPIILTEKEVLIAEGKKAQSLINPYETKFMGELGESEAKRLSALRTAAEDAISSKQIISEGLALVKQGIYTGPAANIKKNFNKWLQETGINIGGQKAANTEAFAGIMGLQVGKIIKAFGSGTGLSDADREYAQKVAGGEITLTEDSIRKLLDINDRLADFTIFEYNSQAERAKQNLENKDYFKAIEAPKIKPSSKFPLLQQFGISDLPNPGTAELALKDIIATFKQKGPTGVTDAQGEHLHHELVTRGGLTEQQFGDILDQIEKQGR